MDLCKYKNALGEPGKGIHSYRLFGVAIVDVIMTVLGSYLISYFFLSTSLSHVLITLKKFLKISLLLKRFA